MMSPEHYYKYVDAADVFMFDRYPTPQSPISTVGEHARASVRAVYGRKPVIAIPQSFDWRVWDGSFKEGDEHRPNYTEMRSSAIQSIAAGVKGIIYWAYTASRYDMRKFPEHEKDYKRLMTELASLLDVLPEPNVPVQLTVEPDFKGIGWGSKIHDGKLYIFAFHGDTSKLDSVKFTLPANISGKTVDVHGEGRTIMMEGNSFTDTFELLASHIYVIPLK
jgi:hypothetical protein